MVHLSNASITKILKGLKLQGFNAGQHIIQTGEKSTTYFVDYLWIAQIKYVSKPLITLAGVKKYSEDFTQETLKQILVFNEFLALMFNEAENELPAIVIDLGETDLVARALECIPLLGVLSLYELDGGMIPNFAIDVYTKGGNNSFEFEGVVRDTPLEKLWDVINDTVKTIVLRSELSHVPKFYEYFLKLR